MKKQIMKTAWEIARNGQQQYGGSVKIYFPESLKLAWQQAKTGRKDMEHRIIIKTDNYNERRWGKPWMAVITANDKGKTSYTFDGEFIGDHGYAGQVMMQVETGKIIAYGQKDRRGNGTINNWYKVVSNQAQIVGTEQEMLRGDVAGLEYIKKADAVNYLLGL